MALHPISFTGPLWTLKRRNKKLGPVLAVLFGMLLVEMALAGAVIQHHYNNIKAGRRASQDIKGLFESDFELIRHTLVSGSVGIGADCVSGVHIMLTWSPEALITDICVTLVDLALSYNAFGYGWKELHLYAGKHGNKEQDKKLVLTNRLPF